jgi:hypothetical protein
MFIPETHSAPLPFCRNGWEAGKKNKKEWDTMG